MSEKYSEKDGEKYYASLYERAYFMDDPQLSEEQKNAMMAKASQRMGSDAGEVENMLSEKERQYDEVWLDQHEGRRMDERIKALNPIRTLKVLSHMANLTKAQPGIIQ